MKCSTAIILAASAVTAVSAVTPTAKKTVALTQMDADKPWMAHHETVHHLKSPGGGYGPGDRHFTGEVENIPISTTMKCIMNLSIQYFLVYTLIAVLRSLKSSPTAKNSMALDTLVEATSTVAYAPMMSVLFLGVRMRAVQLSQNQTEKFGLPTDLCQNFMLMSTYAVLVQLIMVLVYPIVMGKTPETDEDGNMILNNDDENAPRPSAVRMFFSQLLLVVRFLAMAALYGGIVVVCTTAFTMEGPKEIWGDKVPPVSPAVFATMLMTAAYFYVYVQKAILVQFASPRSVLLGLTKIMAQTVQLAPMLCILFIGARMRALQIDPKNGAPQAWAQNCFYLCVASIYVQLVLILFVGTVIKGSQVKVPVGGVEGDVQFELPANQAGMFAFLQALRFVALASLYGGATAVVYSVFTIQHEDPKKTPPISSAMNCVINLTAQYIFVYLFIYIIQTIRQFADKNVLKRPLDAFMMAQKTVMFCPMLAILFIGLRMRALQITSGVGGPPGYAQECMFLATWAVLIQLVMCLIMPFLQSGPVEQDEDGNVKASGSGLKSKICEGVRYFCMVGMYGGACGIVHALIYMTPLNANGEGHIIPGIEVPKPVSAADTVNGMAKDAPAAFF